MSRPLPRADDLRASREWVRTRFGVQGRYGTALRQVNRSLAAITDYEYAFLMSKARLLSCLERWGELARLLSDLARRFSRDAAVWNEVADFFAAHGDWRSCLAVLDKAAPLIRSSSDRHLMDNYYSSRLTCLYALGQRSRAVRQGRSVLKKLPRRATTRSVLKHIETRQLKIDPWAPRAAGYLKEMRRLAI